MNNQKGFSLIELLVVLVIIGIMFFFLIKTIDIEGLIYKAKNMVIRSHMSRVALSVDSYYSAFAKYPDEEEFLSSLKKGNVGLDMHCRTFSGPDYECIYSNNGVNLPQNCDLSNWRTEKEGNNQCYFRYSRDDVLSFAGKDTSYRLYAKAFSHENKMLVFDNMVGEILECPGNMDDHFDISECGNL